MFVEPEAVESKPTIKTDPTASARSSIRRQRTVRYSPNVRDHQVNLNSLLSRNQIRSHGRTRPSPGRRSLLEDVRRTEQSPSLPTFHHENAQDLEEAAANIAHSEASQRSRLESGRALLRDALSYERPGQHMNSLPSDALIRTRNPPSPPTPDELEVLRTSSRSERTRSPPPRYIPTPPYSSGDTSSRSSTHGPTPPLGTASLTPGFAPAHRLAFQDEARANLEREEILTRLSTRMSQLRDAGEREYVAGHRAEINRMRSRDLEELSSEYREAEAAYLESVETRLDLMRRMRERDLSELPPLHRTSRPFQDIVRVTHGRSHGTLDGLGDRERSFSPDDDHWETMLTTIQPDQRIPSANSSFASASASSTSFPSSHVLSQGTAVTLPSTNTDLEACPTNIDNFEDDAIDLLDAQLSHAESISRRIESLSQSISAVEHQHQNHGEHQARHRRRLDREHELQQLEAQLRRLERQIFEEQPAAAGRRRMEGARAGRERL